jgi:hypothetical protein
MSVSKVILFLSFISLGLLLVLGIVAPDTPAMWLASTTPQFAVIRAVLIAALIGLLVTNPPRNVYLRGLVGIISVSLVSWCLNATYNNEMGIVDTMSLLQASVAAGLTVLELDTKEVRQREKSRRSIAVAVVD